MIFHVGLHLGVSALDGDARGEEELAALQIRSGIVELGDVHARDLPHGYGTPRGRAEIVAELAVQLGQADHAVVLSGQTPILWIF